MDIFGYVKELLYTTDCVVVPDLGGFQTTQQAAQIIEAENGVSKFTPPSKTVLFNENLRIGHGILLKYIAKKENRSEREIWNQIKKTVADFKTELSEKKQVSIDGLGIFEINEDNKITLSSRLSDNFDLNTFGLEKFDYSTLKAVKQTTQTKTTQEKSMPVAEAETAENAQNTQKTEASIATSAEEITSEPKVMANAEPEEEIMPDTNGKRSGNFKRIVVWAVVALLAIVVGFFGTKYFSDFTQTDSQAELTTKDSIEAPKPETDTTTELQTTNTEEINNLTTNEETISYTQPETIEETIEEEIIQPGRQEADNLPQQPIPGKYYIVAGSFSQLSSAQEAYEKFKSQGYPALILQQEKLFRVALGYFTDRNAAQKEVENIREVKRNSGIWLWHIN